MEFRRCQPDFRHHGIRKIWDLSANDYAIFAARSNLYQGSAEAMVQLAELEPGMRVVDLACGAGAVSAAILKQPTGPAVAILAIDFSPQMLACARQRLAANNVAYYCEKAERLSKVAKPPVDLIFCNAAFWQFNQERILSELSQSLRPAGKCFISLPAQFTFIENVNALYEENKVIWMILEERSLRGYRIRRSGSPPQPRLPLQLGTDFSQLSHPKLQVERVEDIAVSLTAKDYLDFLRIPVMAENSPLFRGVPAKEAEEILNVVENQLAWMEVMVPPVIWRICIIGVKG